MPQQEGSTEHKDSSAAWGRGGERELGKQEFPPANVHQQSSTSKASPENEADAIEGRNAGVEEDAVGPVSNIEVFGATSSHSDYKPQSHSSISVKPLPRRALPPIPQSRPAEKSDESGGVAKSISAWIASAMGWSSGAHSQIGSTPSGYPCECSSSSSSSSSPDHLAPIRSDTVGAVSVPAQLQLKPLGDLRSLFDPATNPRYIDIGTYFFTCLASECEELQFCQGSFFVQALAYIREKALV